MQEEFTYKTFDGLRPHFDSLARVGYFKIVLKELSCARRWLFNVYRLVANFLVILYNVQHIIRVVLVRHSTDEMVDTLFILLTTLNTLGKEAAFNLRSRRIDDIINTINDETTKSIEITPGCANTREGPHFAASKPYHVDVLKVNAVLMARLLTLYQAAVFTCGTLWTIFPLANRALGQVVQFTGYMPFDTTKTPTFELALAYMNILITFQAYGNVTMDCTIVAFYSQAKIQIQMLRYNLEQLVEFNETKINTSLIGSNKYRYKDDGEQRNELQKRMKQCVVHYQQILQFVDEVESIFSEAMVFQFFVMAWVICMTMYKIVGLSLVSAEFFSMAMYLLCMMSQLFIYCYFGSQLKVESEFINQSIYCSDWLSVSPRFRRQLLVMMECCVRPIAPRTAYIIPMSLDTYIAVLRSSYTLFTFLNR